jgi:hypothetical protein
MQPTPHPSLRRATGWRGDGGSEPTDPTDGPAVLRYLDVVAPLLAAPVVLAFGAPIVGYALGVAAWILVRAFGIAADPRASSITNVAQQVALRLAYRFTRVSLLVAVAVLAFKGRGRADGVTALLVITFAFTIHLSLSIIHRPRLLH